LRSEEVEDEIISLTCCNYEYSKMCLIFQLLECDEVKLFENGTPLCPNCKDNIKQNELLALFPNLKKEIA
jgi:hypothetical protein